jgi:hypothetical protein
MVLRAGDGGKWTCGEVKPGENSTFNVAEKRSPWFKGGGRLGTELSDLRMGRGDEMVDMIGR